MNTSVAPASASEGLTFVSAFEAAIKTGRPIRRSRWFTTSTLCAHPNHANAFILVRYPEQRNWSGEFSPTFEDLQTTDWEVV